MESYYDHLEKNYGIRRPSLMSGVMSVLDIFSNFISPPKPQQSPEEIDREALLSDWKRVGDDLRAAMKQYERDTQR